MRRPMSKSRLRSCRARLTGLLLWSPVCNRGLLVTILYDPRLQRGFSLAVLFVYMVYRALLLYETSGIGQD